MASQNTITVTPAAYTLLGPGPWLIQALNNPITVAISDTQPAAGTAGALIFSGQSLAVNATANVWATTSAQTAMPTYGHIVAGSGGSGTSSNSNSAFPTAGTAAGASNGTDMVPLLVDGSGNLKVNVAAGGGSGRTSSSFGAAFPSTGTAIGAKSGANMVNLTADTSGNLTVDLQTSLPAGANAIGTVGVTPLPALPAGSNAIGSVSASNFPATQAASASSLPIPAGAAQDGTDSTGVSKLSGGVGIRGWLSGIFSKLSNTLTVQWSGQTVSVSNFPATQAICASSLPLPTAAAQDTSVNGILVRQGSTTSGAKGPLIQGAVTAAAPNYTAAQTSPLSLNTSGGLRVDGSGVTQPVSGTITANQGGTWTVQPGNTANTTPWLATINPGGNSEAVTTSNALKVEGSAVTQPVSGKVTAYAGTGTFAHNLTQINRPPISTAATGIQKVGITGNAGAAIDAAGQNAASPANEIIVGGQFNTAPATIASGNVPPLQLDSSGNLNANVSAGGASGGTSSNFGAAFPSAATAIGVSDGTNMQPLKRMSIYTWTEMAGGNALLTTAQQVKSTAGALNGLDFYNPNNSVVWLQIYDSASSPTLGTAPKGLLPNPVRRMVGQRSGRDRSRLHQRHLHCDHHHSERRDNTGDRPFRQPLLSMSGTMRKLLHAVLISLSTAIILAGEANAGATLLPGVNTYYFPATPGTDIGSALNTFMAGIAGNANNNNSGIVILPPGTFETSVEVITPNKIRLKGAGKRATTLQAKACPSGSVVLVGRSTDSVVFDSGLTDMSVDVNGQPSCTGVTFISGQEGTGLENVNVENFTANGVYMNDSVSNGGGTNTNMLFRDVEVNQTIANISGSGFLISGTAFAETLLIDKMTVNLGLTNGNTAASCVSIDHAQIKLNGIHMEGCTDGIYVGSTVSGSIENINTAQYVTQLVHISNNSNPSLALRNLADQFIGYNGLLYSIKDDYNGITHADAYTADATAIMGSMLSESVITVGTSPWAYVNRSAHNQMVDVVGGISAATVTRKASGVARSFGLAGGGLPPVVLAPGDTLTLTYSSTPSVVAFPLL